MSPTMRSTAFERSGVVASAVEMSSEIPPRPSLRSSNASTSSVWALLSSPGVLMSCGPLQQRLGRAAIGRDLRLELLLVDVVRGFGEPLEELVRKLIGVDDDRGEVGGVVLEAALLARVQAPLDREQQQDDDQHADPEGDQPSGHKLALALRPRAAGPRAASCGF